MAKYTFLLPAFKTQYLHDALNSIANQTFDDFECIVSDDCSPDDIRSVFEKAIGSDSRFTYRRNGYNLGANSLVAHWNLLVGLCETDYLIMASDDDFYAPTFLEEVERLTTMYPNVDLFRGRCNRINEEGIVFAEDNICIEFESQSDFLYETYCHNRLKCIANYVFKSQRLKEIGGFVDFPLAWGSDDATVISISRNGVCNTSGVVFSFRCANQNISSDWSIMAMTRKMQAKISNLIWFSSYKNYLKSDVTLLSECRLRSFENYYVEECISQIKLHSPMLNIKNAYNNFMFLKKSRYFYSRTEILCYWLSWLIK